MRPCNCNKQHIDAFLADDIMPDDHEVAEQLEVCSGCRDYFDRQAATPKYWKEARQYLQPTEFDAASSVVCTAGHSVDPVDRSLSVKAVVDLLAPSDDPDSLGRLGSYEVTGVIGVGGMGVVLKAVDMSLDRVVAIKVLAPYLADSETARSRFAREAKAAAAVLHPNVIPIHGVSIDAPIPFLVMSYIRGGSLQRRLERDGPLPTLEILRIGSQVASGLAAAHEKGLIHRDIKPANILLEDGVERVTITDFGLARAVDDASVTRVGTIAGTPKYMSPEQVRGESLDHRSDLFSLGTVLYELACGQPPFQSDSSYGVMRSITDSTAPPLAQQNSEVPPWLCQVIAKLMQNDKSSRFDFASEVSCLLDACLSHLQEPTSAELPVSLLSAESMNASSSSSFFSRWNHNAYRGIVGMFAMTALCVSFFTWVTAPKTPEVDGSMHQTVAFLEAFKTASEDTEYAASYSEPAFQAIKDGESLEDVEKKLGKPLRTQSVTPHTLWLYAPVDYPAFSKTGVYPSIECECNVISFDETGKFVRAYGQSAGQVAGAADGQSVVYTSGSFPIKDPASIGARAGVPGPLKLSAPLYRKLLAEKATQKEIRNRFGKPKAEFASRVSKWLVYSHSPSGGNYRKRMIGLDKQGRVCDKRSEFYWD